MIDGVKVVDELGWRLILLEIMGSVKAKVAAARASRVLAVRLLGCHAGITSLVWLA